MIDEPKIINVPGIDTPLREQTLAEYCMALPPGHLALRELTELQRRSSEMFRLAAENKNMQAEITHLKLTYTQTPVAQAMIAGLTTEGEAMAKALMELKVPTDYVPGKKVPCKLCGKEISVSKGAWARHLQSMHPEEDRSLPQL